MAKIGVFDSGYGGLTIYKSIHARLPAYDYIYLGDNARAPYGDRSFEAIYRFSSEAVEYLFSQGCQLIIVACNTASARALRTIQQQLLPRMDPRRRVLGIIRPLVEDLAQGSAGTVALWATAGTVQSRSYAIELAKLRPDLRLVQVACPLLVPLVENGELSGPGLNYFLRKYWDETARRAPDAAALLLACTHYPLLSAEIAKVVPASVRVLEQGGVVAASLADYLRRHPEMERDLGQGGSSRFLTTDQSESFDRLAQLFLGQPVHSERVEL